MEGNTYQNSSSRKMKQQKLREALNKELEEFFEDCKAKSFSKQDMDKILSSFTRELEIRRWKKFGLSMLVSAVLIWLCINVDFLNWLVSAIGRILMIQLLPFWDWTYLYSAKCLIPRATGDSKPSELYEIGSSGEIGKENCVLCEHLDRVAEIDDATFHYIEEQFLFKGHPVIIRQSHEPVAFPLFVETIASEEDYMETDPCDMESSFMLRRLAALDDFFEKAMSANDNEPWFFHMRNCLFRGVKASRKFTPKPRFHPVHLEPFYSSWLLMSSRFTLPDKPLYVEGLVVALQMSGRLEIILTAKNPCLDVCRQHRVVLGEGEALVLSTDLWDVAYSSDGLDRSATIITETKWD